jgi:hypothetical protein
MSYNKYLKSLELLRQNPNHPNQEYIIPNNNDTKPKEQSKSKKRILKTQRKQRFTTTKKIIGTKKQNPKKTIKKNKKICNNIEEIVKLIRLKLDPKTYPTDTHANTRKTIQKITRALYRWEKNGNKSLGIKPHCKELIGVTNSVRLFTVELLNLYIYFMQPSEDRMLDIALGLDREKSDRKQKELEEESSTRRQYEKRIPNFKLNVAFIKLGKRKRNKSQGNINLSSNNDNPKKRLKLNNFFNTKKPFNTKNPYKYMHTEQNHSLFNQYHHIQNMYIQHPHKNIQQNHGFFNQYPGFFNQYQIQRPSYQYPPTQNYPFTQIKIPLYVPYIQHPHKNIQQNHGFPNQNPGFFNRYQYQYQHLPQFNPTFFTNNNPNFTNNNPNFTNNNPNFSL